MGYTGTTTKPLTKEQLIGRAKVFINKELPLTLNTKNELIRQLKDAQLNDLAVEIEAIQ